MFAMNFRVKLCFNLDLQLQRDSHVKQRSYFTLSNTRKSHNRRNTTIIRKQHAQQKHSFFWHFKNAKFVLSTYQLTNRIRWLSNKNFPVSRSMKLIWEDVFQSKTFKCIYNDRGQNNSPLLADSRPDTLNDLNASTKCSWHHCLMSSLTSSLYHTFLTSCLTSRQRIKWGLDLIVHCKCKCMNTARNKHNVQDENNAKDYSNGASVQSSLFVIYWLAVAELRCSLLMATVQSLRRTW